MKRFLIGLGLSLLFLVVWLLISLISGITMGLGGQKVLLFEVILYISFFGMVLAPFYFWLVAPVIDLVRKRRHRSPPPADYHGLFHRPK